MFVESIKGACLFASWQEAAGLYRVLVASKYSRSTAVVVVLEPYLSLGTEYSVL